MIWMEGGQTWVTTKAGALRSTGKGAAWPPHNPRVHTGGQSPHQLGARPTEQASSSIHPCAVAGCYHPPRTRSPKPAPCHSRASCPEQGLLAISPLLGLTSPSLPGIHPRLCPERSPSSNSRPCQPGACPDPFHPPLVSPCPRTFIGCFQHSPVPAPPSFTPGTIFPLGLAPSHSTLNELPGSKCPKCPIGTVYPALGTGGLGEDLARVHACVSVPTIQGFASLSFLLL